MNVFVMTVIGLSVIIYPFTVSSRWWWHPVHIVESAISVIHCLRPLHYIVYSLCHAAECAVFLCTRCLDYYMYVWLCIDQIFCYFCVLSIFYLYRILFLSLLLLWEHVLGRELLLFTYW